MLETNPTTALKIAWLEAASTALSPGTPNAELNTWADRFFDTLFQAAAGADSSVLESILDEWKNLQTNSNLITGEITFSRLIHTLLLITLKTIQERLSEGQAIELIGQLSPYFGLLYLKAGKKEREEETQDLTKRLETTLQHLKSIESSRMDFIAVAGHELKTPLTLIDGYAAMLSESLGPSGTSYQKSLLDGIQNGTTRLRIVINDMIDVSMIDNGILTLNIQPVWLGHLLTLLDSEVKDTLLERRQQLFLNDFPGLHQMIFGDPEKLLQALRNVLTNAIKYTPDGGSITISGINRADDLEITIQDTGIGIGPENLNMIFEKFVRFGKTALHSSGKYKFKGGGPGLGLYIARGIIEAHGGRIWVDSPGFDELACPGSTFHILLPSSPVPPEGKSSYLYATMANHHNKTPKDG